MMPRKNVELDPEPIEVEINAEETKPVRLFHPLKENADIKSAKDLLILQEKRKTQPELSPSFYCVGRYGDANLDKGKYESKLTQALRFIDSCLFTHDREGNPLGDFAQANRLRSIGVELPPRLSHYGYIPENSSNIPSFWSDAENYAYLWRQKRPEMETETG